MKELTALMEMDESSPPGQNCWAQAPSNMLPVMNAAGGMQHFV